MVEIYRDAGISGAKRRDQRPGLDATKPKITISSANALIPQRALPFIKRRLYQTGFLLAQMTFERATHFAPESAAVTHACSSRGDLAAAKLLRNLNFRCFDPVTVEEASSTAGQALACNQTLGDCVNGGLNQRTED